MNDINEFQTKIGIWGSETFPQSSPGTILAHLKDEVAELQSAWDTLRFDDSEDAEEAADCFLLLLHYAHRRGFSLFDAAVVKAAINEKRKWEPTQNERGYQRHVEGE